MSSQWQDAPSAPRPPARPRFTSHRLTRRTPAKDRATAIIQRLRNEVYGPWVIRALPPLDR